MRIVVEKVEDAHHVKFSSLYGGCLAQWEGSSPLIGNAYDVEIDIPCVLTWGLEATYSEEEQYQIKEIGRKILVIGKLESIHDDGYAVFRMGESVTLLEIRGIQFSKMVFLKLEINNLILHEISL
ncbi:hypothetical protein [Marininema halotolerans]|uniref:Uncharacterized protein n=1 Tax=Marininema halotolerans TaxID=1155944 RepID=A0A1I6UPA9_9BACL|nr:hypothetical protein [Marininema halotolerans]SFT03107.1 hypothetical protein SAMN05444972_11854 [Marininema halotolerans]